MCRISIPALNERSPTKILVCNLAHLGDVVLSTALLARIKERYPHSQIGILIGKESLPVVKAHPLIDHIHVLDHWKLSRSPRSLFSKINTYLRDRQRVICDLRNAGYEMSIDLYHFFPNAIPLVWRAGIPIRIGYSSGGFSPLLTHSFPWADEDNSIAYSHLKLIEKNPDKKELRPQLPPLSLSSELSAAAKIPARALEQGYCVFHMGASTPMKNWQESHWRALLEHVTEQGHYVLFTGQGDAQTESINRMTAGIERAVGLGDALTWDEFVYVIKRAKLLISVDSVPGHIASAYQVPTISLFTGINRTSQWKPLNSQGHVLTKKVPCAPCFRKKGCETMDCIRTISVEEVVALAMPLLNNRV